MTNVNNFDDFDGDFDFSKDWMKDLFFPDPYVLGPNNVNWIPDGPLGSSRRASSNELVSLAKAADENVENYVRLLPAYAIAHDPSPTPIDMGPLPLPLGIDCPNMLVFGRSGGGKTQMITLPVVKHAMQSGWTVVCVNVKGVKQTRQIRRLGKQFGRRVQTIAPTKLNRTLACTLLEGCDLLAQAKEVAEAMTANAARKSRDGGGAWAYNQAEDFVRNAICAVCNNLPKSRRNLIEIRKVVEAGSYHEFADQHLNFPGLKRFARYVSDGNKNAETISETIGEITAFIDEFEEFLSKDELSFKSLAENGGVVIIEIDIQDIRRLRPIVTLFLTRLKSNLQRKACSSATGRLPHKTVIVIDELIASGPIPGLAEDLHTCRELNFSFVAGAQSISQLVNIYGDEAQALLDGFQTQIAIPGGLDLPTAEHFSRRTGVATIALPGMLGKGEPDGDTALSCHWQLSSRPVFLASEIVTPKKHPLLGMAATIIVGDGKTPPFQAFLTPCHQNGSLAKMMEDVEAQTVDDDLRKVPLKKVRKRISKVGQTAKLDSTLPPGISNTKGWSESQLKSKIEQLRLSLGWKDKSDSASKWWNAFEETNKTKLTLVLRVLEELVVRKATITEFYLAFIYSNIENIQGVLAYLDYSRIKKDEEQKKRKAAEEARTKDIDTGTKAAASVNPIAEAASENGSKAIVNSNELSLLRCPMCRSLVPSGSSICRICGNPMPPAPILDSDATTGFEVKLTSFGTNILKVIAYVKEATGRSRLDCKKLVESAPTVLGRASTKETAAKVVQQIEAVGGRAHIV